jgi:hypothetical protein
MPRIPYKDLMQSDEMAEKLEMSTAEIGLSVRTTNCLEGTGSTRPARPCRFNLISLPERRPMLSLKASWPL